MKCWFCGKTIHFWQRHIKASIPIKEDKGGRTFYGDVRHAFFHSYWPKEKSCADDFMESMDWWTLGHTRGSEKFGGRD